MQEISSGELIAQLKEERTGSGRLQLVDVRSGGEFAAGHIPGAVNIPLEQLPLREADLARDGTLVLICQTGRRARLAAGTLPERGVRISVLEGGTAAWLKRELPIVRTGGGVAATWSMERQVRFTAGLLVVTGGVLGIAASGAWNYLSLFVGAGLAFSGLTGTCGMGTLLQAMPWNRPVPLPAVVAWPVRGECADGK